MTAWSKWLAMGPRMPGGGRIFFFFTLSLVVTGLCCFALAFSSCRERAYSPSGLLIAVVSPVAEHRLQVHGFSSCCLWTRDHWLSSCDAWA